MNDKHEVFALKSELQTIQKKQHKARQSILISNLNVALKDD